MSCLLSAHSVLDILYARLLPFRTPLTGMWAAFGPGKYKNVPSVDGDSMTPRSLELA